MKISVIVPVYNCKSYLNECVDSILHQSYTDLEIILVDDGSTDGSSDICDTFSSFDKRVKVIHQKNQGVSVARNSGLNIADGELVAFVDGDDTLEFDMYETLVRLLNDYDADIVHCGYRKVFFDGTSKEVLGTNELMLQEGIDACECIVKGQHFTGSPCTKLYKRILLNDIRFDPTLKINEDVLFNIQAFKIARKTVFFDIPKYHYYEREQSATRKTNLSKVLNDAVAAAESMLNLLKNTSAESACAERLYYALVNLYRYYVFNRESNRALLKEIDVRLSEIKSSVSELSFRTVFNYRFLRYFPKLYVCAYRIYKRIRVPNYDI